MHRWWPRLSRRALDLEAPTWALVVLIYGGWLATTFWWHCLPTIVLVPLAAWICAWQISLQHELIHGHPTRSARLNRLLGTPPLNLWLPYALYRRQHLRHHRDTHLTDPLEDPESTYLSPPAWAGAGPLRRLLHSSCNTALGRLTLGPLQAVSLFWLGQWRAAGSDDAPPRLWLAHAAWVLAIGVWVVGVCRIHPLAYIACFVYPGTALAMLRSLAEHRAAERSQDRTAVVERAGLFGLLFLHNNLHLLHHERPSLPWYELPRQWRLTRAVLLEGREVPLYRGYLDVVARYAVRPHHPGPHPVRPTRAVPAGLAGGGEADVLTDATVLAARRCDGAAAFAK